MTRSTRLLSIRPPAPATTTISSMLFRRPSADTPCTTLNSTQRKVVKGTSSFSSPGELLLCALTEISNCSRARVARVLTANRSLSCHRCAIGPLPIHQSSRGWCPHPPRMHSDAVWSVLPPKFRARTPVRLHTPAVRQLLYVTWLPPHLTLNRCSHREARASPLMLRFARTALLLYCSHSIGLPLGDNICLSIPTV